MPRDYKYRARKKPQKKPLPGWLWLLTGLLLGGFIVGLVWLRGQSDYGGGEWIGAPPDRPPQGKPASPERAAAVPPAPKPRFDFYNMLPEMEVAVPDEPFEPRPPKSQPPQAQQPQPATADGRYLLQIGSFRDTADADRMKAQLALLGIEARVVGARISPNDTRYRVRSGPYRGRAEVDRAAKRLAENGFPTMRIPLPR